MVHSIPGEERERFGLNAVIEVADFLIRRSGQRRGRWVRRKLLATARASWLRGSRSANVN